MASTIQLKTGTGSAVPSSLTQGEVGINIDNGLIFYGSGSGNVVKKLESFTNITASSNISASGTLTSLSGSFGEVSASGFIHGEGYIIQGKSLAHIVGPSELLAFGYQDNIPIRIGRTANPTRIAGNISASGNITATGSIHTLGDITASGDIKGSTLTGTVGTATQGTIDHDSLANFVANEHIDHTSVTLSAGNGLSGGGDISTNRSFAVDAAQTTITSVTNTGLKVGRATDDTYIDFGTDDKIQLKPANATALEVETTGIDVTGEITASGNISASGNLVGTQLDVNGFAGAVKVTGGDTGNLFAISNIDTLNLGKLAHLTTTNLVGSLHMSQPDAGHITASGNISASGDILAAGTGSFGRLEATSNTALQLLNNQNISFENAAGTEFAQIKMSTSDQMIFQNLRSNKDIFIRAGNAGNEGNVIIQKGGTETTIAKFGTAANLELEGNFSASGNIKADGFIETGKIPLIQYISTDATSTAQGRVLAAGSHNNETDSFALEWDTSLFHDTDFFETGSVSPTTAGAANTFAVKQTGRYEINCNVAFRAEAGARPGINLGIFTSSKASETGSLRPAGPSAHAYVRVASPAMGSTAAIPGFVIQLSSGSAISMKVDLKDDFGGIGNTLWSGSLSHFSMKKIG